MGAVLVDIVMIYVCRSQFSHYISMINIEGIISKLLKKVFQALDLETIILVLYLSFTFINIIFIVLNK